MNLYKKIIFLILLSYSIQANAIQSYILGEDKIRADISSKTINRIEFDSDGISEIIGDEDKYQFSSDMRGMNFFLRSNNQTKEPIELSVISNSGQVADLVLTPRNNIDGQIIKIKSYGAKSDYRRNIKQEAKKMLEAMIAGDQGKYYIYNIGKMIDADNTKFNKKALKIKQEYIYRFGNLIGTKLVIHNKSRNSEYLSKEDMKQLFQGVVTLSIDQDVIKPRKKTTVFLISYEAKNND